MGASLPRALPLPLAMDHMWICIVGLLTVVTPLTVIRGRGGKACTFICSWLHLCSPLTCLSLNHSSDTPSIESFHTGGGAQGAAGAQSRGGGTPCTCCTRRYALHPSSTALAHHPNCTGLVTARHTCMSRMAVTHVCPPSPVLCVVRWLSLLYLRWLGGAFVPPSRRGDAAPAAAAAARGVDDRDAGGWRRSGGAPTEPAVRRDDERPTGVS